MSVSTGLPAVKRLCAFTAPLNLASSAQLAKNANVADLWTSDDVESPSEPQYIAHNGRTSLKRRRQGGQVDSNERKLNSRNSSLRVRLAPSDHSDPSRIHSKLPSAPSTTPRPSGNDVKAAKLASPTPRSAPFSALTHHRSIHSPRVRGGKDGTIPLHILLRRAATQVRALSSSSHLHKPALAYHNIVANAIETATVGSTTDSSATRGASTVAQSSTEGTSSPSLDEKAVATETKPRRPSCLPPRPPSPYGEINQLIRHPTLYDPIRKPRHPIVLCHGLYGFDVRGPGFFRLHYWGDLLKILRGKIGAEVYVTAVPGTGSVKNRANVLHKSLEDTPSLLNRDINFVAHSMGGLDARYLISQIQPTLYHPRSLTSICTPHRGSEFMAWCRANIGIGTDLESSEAVRKGNSSSLEDPDDTSIPLPLTLKSPILSREQVEAAKKATAIAKAAAERGEKFNQTTKFPGLPFNLSTTVTSYLLNLLDSPAYANLTPTFLRDVFNPTTPNLPDVKYYSIAGRTEKIPIWHPLWLPKLVLDGAEQARIKEGAAAPPEWRGNDGLVNVDSARWGEFLGTFDGADHWEMRGSSGLISAEASKHAVEEITRSEFRKTKEPVQGEKAERVQGGIEDERQPNGPTPTAEKEKDRGWQWQDVYALIGKLKGNGKKNGSTVKAKEVQKEAPISTPAGGGAEVAALRPSTPSAPPRDPLDAKGLASAADWIVSQLPGNASTKAAAQLANKAGDVAASVAVSATSSASSAASSVTGSVLNNPATRMLYGAPGGSPSSSSPSPSPPAANDTKYDKFSLEHMTVALCRKLYNDGL